MSQSDRHIVRISARAEQGQEDVLRDTTVEDRWDMLWQLTVEEWLRKGIDVTDIPMSKDAVRRKKLRDQ